MRITSILFAGIIAGAAVPARAGEPVLRQVPDVEITAGIGFGWLEANEYGYQLGNRVKQRIWEAEIPVLALGAKVDLRRHWYLSSNLAAGFNSTGHMSEYDWTAFSPSLDFDDWAGRSLHPNTDLDYYVDLDIAAGRSFDVTDALTLDLHGGLKYTATKWSAFGGSYISSDVDLRDTAASLPDGFSVATYEQDLPGAFLGAGGEWQHGNWSLSGHARGGLAFGVETAHDDMLILWRMTDKIETMPFLALAARVDYRIGERSSIFLAGTYDRYFRRTGDLTVHDIFVDDFWTTENISGADFSAAALNVGFKLSF